MTDKKSEELNEQELDQVTGGGADSHDAYANLQVSHLKPGLSKGKTVRATKGLRSNIVDCFTTFHINHFERDGRTFQDDISSLNFEDLSASNIHHVGWLVSVYLSFQSNSSLDAGNFENLQDVAICVSAMLNCSKDIDNFRQDNGQRHRSKEAKIENVASILGLDYSEIRPFMLKISDAFNFNPKYPSRAKFGVSDYVVVRDVWALLACLLDSSSMFSIKIENLGTLDFHNSPQQKDRMFSYFQEVIDHIGQSVGLTKSPWREPVNVT